MESVRYLAGDSFLGRRDPRVLILVPALTVVTVALIQDLRLMAPAAAIALGYYASARIPFAAVRANWAFVALFVVILAGVNGLVAGTQQYHSSTMFAIPVIGVPVSSAAIAYAATMLLRFLAITATGFPLAFAIRPGDLAVAFARLGVPARFAYAIDLTFRFVPTVSTSLHETIAAQRLRGYEVAGTRNPVRRIRQLRPLIVPVTVGAFVDAEDVADALDLRGFGAQRRTWLRTIHFGAVDLAVIGAFALATILAVVATVSGTMPGLWYW
ncbi:energy-coupling factor transporter transmembrane component T family protein [Mycolicibacterium porcinum]|uniref:Energy-coupling factor transporter transmembrane component T n=1 Tax=Mycolicibacterium porcinum TaxID=39693 RepID=A0ABV3VIR6_9MYCO